MNGVNEITNPNIDEGFSIEEYNEFQKKYTRALMQLQSILELIKLEFESDQNYNNMIAKIDSRIKSRDSIIEKMHRRKLPINVQEIEKSLDDIAGIRVICYFKNDLFRLIEILKKSGSIRIIEEEDYIVANPKPSGYRSYHMTVEVPVEDHINNTIHYVKVEIQIRTLLMDLFASLEHKFRYKKDDIFTFTKEISQQISSLADFTQKVDDIYLNGIDKLITIKEENLPGYNDAINTRIENMMPKYIRAQKRIETIINDIAESFKNDGDNSPIEKTETRLKAPKDIYKKLSLQGYDMSQFNIDNHLTDIVGARIVCSFLSDVEIIVKTLKEVSKIKELGIEIVAEKNYIENPKENGYSSYHMIVKVPVYTDGHCEYVFAEIQIRTKIMDNWASLERQCCYKKKCLPEVRNMLKRLSVDFRAIDYQCDRIIQELKESSLASQKSISVKGNRGLRRMKVLPNN